MPNRSPGLVAEIAAVCVRQLEAQTGIFGGAPAAAAQSRQSSVQTLEIRVRGRVQGVGFRPSIWRIARELRLAGEVCNDGEGVLLRVSGDQARIAALLNGAKQKLPPLARIENIEIRPYRGELPKDFRIVESRGVGAHTQVAPDAVVCKMCAAELRDRKGRRVIMRTVFGGERIVDMLVGEQLPRIC